MYLELQKWVLSHFIFLSALHLMVTPVLPTRAQDNKTEDCSHYSKKKCWTGQCVKYNAPCNRWDCDFRSCNDLSACYADYDWCDGYESCADGSDELNCHLKEKQSSTPEWILAAEQDYYNWSTWYQYGPTSPDNNGSPGRGWKIFFGIGGTTIGLIAFACTIKHCRKAVSRTPDRSTAEASSDGTGVANATTTQPPEHDPVNDLPPDYNEALSSNYNPKPEEEIRRDIDESGLPSYELATEYINEADGNIVATSRM